jgi:hypothetical protein
MRLTTGFPASWRFCQLGLLLSLSSLCIAQQAALGIHRDISQLTDEAATIFQGRVVSATVEPHPEFSSLMTVLVTMHVDEVLKGDTVREITFRQYVWDVRARYNGAGYSKGQELLLFLRPPSQYGLTSPAGLQQGRFVIHRDAAGRAEAVNGDGNLGLFDRLPANAKAHRAVLPAASLSLASKRSGPVDVTVLKQVVRAFTGQSQ